MQTSRKPTKTNRGFKLVTFQDSYGQLCSIQESSAVPCIWVGVDVDPFGKEVGARMHLNETQARSLANSIINWLDNDQFTRFPIL